jgi:hypothetical protein
VRLFALVLMFAACDHRPPAKQQPTPPPVAVTSPDAGAAAVPPTPPPVDEACLQLGVKLAAIIIDATTDPSQKAAYEQERTKLVKRFSDNCASEKWPEKVRTCFMGAKTPSEVEVCSRDLVKPAPPAPPTPPAGSGSAAGSAARPGSAVDPHAGHAH